MYMKRNKTKKTFMKISMIHSKLLLPSLYTAAEYMKGKKKSYDEFDYCKV